MLSAELDLLVSLHFFVSRADRQAEAAELAQIRSSLARHASGASQEQIEAAIAAAEGEYARPASMAERLERLEAAAAGLRWSLSTAERNALLVELMHVARADGATEAEEVATVRAVRDLIQRSVTREQYRLLAFIYYTMAEADDQWTNEDTLILHDFLEQQSGSLTREQSVEIAREAYSWVLEVQGNAARLAVIEAALPRSLGHLTAIERAKILDNVEGLALADDSVTKGEDSVHVALKALLAK